MLLDKIRVLKANCFFEKNSCLVTLVTLVNYDILFKNKVFFFNFWGILVL